MGIMGMNGFEAQRLEDDGLIYISGVGSPLYNTAVPVGSSSLRSLRTNQQVLVQPWISGEQAGGTRIEPSGAEYWFHFEWQPSSSSSNNNRIGVSRNQTQVITISKAATTNFVQIYVANVLRATGTVPFAINRFNRVHVFVNQVAGGNVEVYFEGDLVTPVLTYTLVAGDIAALPGKPDEFYMDFGRSGIGYLDDVFAMDPNDGVAPTNINNLANASVEPSLIDGNGFYTAWTGDFTDIDEVPANDGDFIEATAINQASTFDCTDTARDNVFFVQTKWRMGRTGTTAGVNVQIRQRLGATDLDETITTAPGSGNVIQHHNTDATGATWSVAGFNGSQFGPVSRT